MPDAAQVNLLIDREKANTFGVTFADINSTSSANLGSAYVNDFPNAGRMQLVPEPHVMPKAHFKNLT